MRERFRPSSVFAPVERRALLRFASICFSEIIITYLVACCRFLSTMRDQGKAGAVGLRAEAGSALGRCRDWGCGNLGFISPNCEPGFGLALLR